ncbi:MAG: acyl-[acyl-carrier-protein]--UDP-N-acetylglucosamine O-acyltransferase [Acidobacteria bacterium]|nr:MAG: acyl-[acyl-carrier-protein]--UDP-N-acetylglucosamine O-acyltransferase [Acidobacteriota bacterium]
MSSTQVHPMAIVHPGARLGERCRIGPFSVVGDQVQLGAGCELVSHVVIQGDTEVGEECRFFPFSSVGLEPQDLKYHGERTRVRIGSHNLFRECCTVHSGTAGGGGVTSIGDRCDTVFANAATLAGHVVVENFAVIGAFSGVHQFCRIGAYAYIGGYSVITQDALPYILTVGNRARAFGINVIGLKRRAFPEQTLNALKRAYRLLFQSKLTTSRALEQMEQEMGEVQEVVYLASFIKATERGIIK